jgi:hypothetical protein
MKLYPLKIGASKREKALYINAELLQELNRLFNGDTRYVILARDKDGLVKVTL